MGEYAQYGNERIKIGTCEDMYYLRFGQRDLVQIEGYSLYDAEVLAGIRFRFPFPDEDNVEPGAFDPFERSIAISGVEVPDGRKHYSVQFSARPPGYLLSIPCPEGPEKQPFKIHRNGFNGAVRLVQQAVRGGVLAPVFGCGGCGARWSEPEREGAQFAIDYFRAFKVDRYTSEEQVKYNAKIADRIEAGYAVEVQS